MTTVFLLLAGFFQSFAIGFFTGGLL